MKSITQMYETAIATKKRKSWEKIYIIVDIHETILYPNWTTKLSNQFYPNAKKCLRLLSTMDSIVLILWSCSLPENNIKYQQFFKKEKINFNYINSNPEVVSNEYADFDTKLYASIILDDKAGFEPEKDWEELYYAINL